MGEEPARIDAPFDVRSGQAVVLTLTFDPERSVQGGVEFQPRFTGAVPARTPPTLVGACSNTRTNDVTLFDTWTKAVTNVVATGRSPYGLALEPLAARAFVALSGQDQIDVVDLSRAESASRIPMRGGDEPRALQMLPDRRTLLVLNFRSQTASFVDAFTTQELARVPVGEAPWSITLQRGGNRAFVLNRRSNNLTVIDLGTRQAIATVPTEPEPLFGQVSRDGKRLYVIHAGSPYMNEYALPGLTVSRKIRVGLGAIGDQAGHPDRPPLRGSRGGRAASRCTTPSRRSRSTPSTCRAGCRTWPSTTRRTSSSPSCRRSAPSPSST